MENITNLVSQAKSAIEEFEKFMFTNHLEKYITTREFVSSMNAAISSAEALVRLDAVTEEDAKDMEEKLNSIITKVSSITASFTNGNNIGLHVNEDGEYVAEEISEQANLTSFTDYQPIESSAVKITDYEPESVPGDVTVEKTVEEEIPTPVTVEAAPLVQPVEESGENFSEALDIKAIDDFLNQNVQENSATLTL